MKGKTLMWAFCLWAFAATPALASVRINEIAWMGTEVSGSDEWIEIYNPDATPVDLSGWTIAATDGSPSIALSGAIAANGYFLIERTDDSTVPDIAADLVASFGNGLSNSGETLQLKNADATIVDTVSGGTDWTNIGGNNTTKETAQRTFNSWVTGAGTPRSTNTVQDGEVLAAETSGGGGAHTTTSAAPSASANPVSRVSAPDPYPRKYIVVEAGDDKRAFAGFPVSFVGSSTGLYNEPLDRASYQWNFGDGAVSHDRVTTHIYEFPGDYIATLEVFWGTYRVSDRLAVSAVLPNMVITKAVPGENGYVELENRTDREIDLAGWMIATADGKGLFIFPSYSIVLPQKTFLLPTRISKITAVENGITLRYPNGGNAFLFMPGAATPASKTPAPSLGVAATISQGVRSFQNMEKIVTPSPGTLATVSEKGGAAAVLWEKNPRSLSVGLGSLPHDEKGMKWFFALLGVMLVILAGFIISRSNSAEQTVADEYAIIEDIIEGRDDLVAKH